MDALLLARVLARRRRLRGHERWPREKLASYQARAVARLRRFAVARSPFYARLHRGLETAPLESLPVVTKAQLMECFDEVVTDRRIRWAELSHALPGLAANELYLNRFQVAQTAGSTGTRGVFLWDPSEWASVLASYSRPYEWAGIHVDLLHRTSMAVVSSKTSWHQSARVASSASSPLIRTLRLDAGDPIRQNVELLNAFQPQSLIAYASMLGMLAEEQLSGRLSIHPSSVLSASEVLLPGVRARVKEAFGSEPFNVYGSTEGAGVAAECDQHRGLHLSEDLVFVEFVDEKNRPVPLHATSAKVLLTVLFSRTQPLIRYEVSDRLMPLGDAPCPCGRTFARIGDIEGRAEDVLVFGGVPVHPVVFDSVLSPASPHGWQVEQTELGVRVRLLSAPQGAEQQARAGLQLALANAGVRNAEIDLVGVDELPRTAAGKLKLIVPLAKDLRAPTNR